MRDYRVMLFIEGRGIPSSCIAIGTQEHCESICYRLNQHTVDGVEYKPLPVIGGIK